MFKFARMYLKMQLIQSMDILTINGHIEYTVGRYVDRCRYFDTTVGQQCSQSMCPLRLHFLGHFCQSVALSVTTAATKLLGASSLGVGQPRVCGYRWHV